MGINFSKAEVKKCSDPGAVRSKNFVNKHFVYFFRWCVYHSAIPGFDEGLRAATTFFKFLLTTYMGKPWVLTFLFHFYTEIFWLKCAVT